MAGSLNRRFLIVGLVVAAALAQLVACSSTNASDSGSAMTPNAGPGASIGGAGNGFNIGNPGGAQSSGVGGTSLPPEQKATIVVDVPKASKNYVYAANPDRDSVAIINPSSLSIQTVSVDAAPHGLQTLPGQDGAIVVNTGASTVSVLRTGKDGSTHVSTVPVMTGANVVSIAPDGQHALVYYDASQPTAGPSTDSPKQVSAIDLSQDTPVVYNIKVGYRTTNVKFYED